MKIIRKQFREVTTIDPKGVSLGMPDSGYKQDGVIVTATEYGFNQYDGTATVTVDYEVCDGKAAEGFVTGHRPPKKIDPSELWSHAAFAKAVASGLAETLGGEVVDLSEITSNETVELNVERKSFSHVAAEQAIDVLKAGARDTLYDEAARYLEEYFRHLNRK